MYKYPNAFLLSNSQWQSQTKKYTLHFWFILVRYWITLKTHSCTRRIIQKISNQYSVSSQQFKIPMASSIRLIFSFNSPTKFNALKKHPKITYQLVYICLIQGLSSTLSQSNPTQWGFFSLSNRFSIFSLILLFFSYDTLFVQIVCYG